MALNASCQFRGYASKKDAKKGGKGGKGGKKGSDDDDEDDHKGKGKSSGGSTSAGNMSFDPLDLEKKMGQCLERLKKDFVTMRAGTANPGNRLLCVTVDSCISFGWSIGMCLTHQSRPLICYGQLAILDPVNVKVENKMVPLRDLAQVSIKDAKTLMVNVNDVEVNARSTLLYARRVNPKTKFDTYTISTLFHLVIAYWSH